MLDILLNVVRISDDHITGCLENLLEIIYLMLKDIDTEIVRGAEKLDGLLKIVIKDIEDQIYSLDLMACLDFICSHLETGKREIKSWNISWISIFLTLDKIDLIQNSHIFLKVIINLMGKESNEVVKSAEKFMNDARTKFRQSKYIKNKDFCIRMLKILVTIFDEEPHLRKKIETFKWIQDILDVQLNTPIDEIHEKKETGRQFKNIVSAILLNVLECIREDEEDIKIVALRLNSLLQAKIDKILLHEEVKVMVLDQDNFYFKIFNYLKLMMAQDSNSKTIYYAMKWIDSLLIYFPNELMSLKGEIVENLHHPDIEILETSVILISKYLNTTDDYSMIEELLRFIEETPSTSTDLAK